MTSRNTVNSNNRKSGPLAWIIMHMVPSENTVLLALAIVVGLLGGLAAVAFHTLIEVTHTLVYETEQILELAVVPGMINHNVLMVLGPTLGGLIAGTLVWLLARHDHSHGTASVMEAVALHGGRLNTRPLLVKSLAAGLLIGAGGSAGPEDPSVKIGAVVGSSVSNRRLGLRLSEQRVKTLVTAGVASSIAAIFNAPIAGVFFAMEVIAGDFSTALFAPVVLASVTGSIVGRALLGTDAAFAAPHYELVHPLIETPLYGLLGLIAALVGVAFIRMIFLSEDVFEWLHNFGPLRSSLGGMLVGLTALAAPGVLGVGYETAAEILNGTGPVGMALFLLLGCKFLATIVTLGAVRVGGTFAPSLVIGAMVGGLFGQGVTLLLPGLTGPPAAYALVGMGAMLNAVVRAPITAVLLLFELTGDYAIILAIMASVVVSQVVAHWLHAESIYTERLARKGIQLRFGRDVNILELVKVGEVMTPDFTTVPKTMTLARLEALFDRTRHHGFPVLDEQGKLFGMVTVSDLRRAQTANLASDTPIEAIVTRELTTIHPDQSLNVAMRKFALADVGRLPVIDRDDPSILVGMLRRTHIIKAYRRGAMQRAEMERRLHQMRLRSRSDAHVIEITIPEQSACVGHLLRDLNLPGEVIITSIQRQEQSIIPRGDTVLQGGDHLTLLTTPDQVERVEAQLSQGKFDNTAPHYHELRLASHAPAVGRSVAELGLPVDALIVTLRRDGQVQAVHGDTILQEGDELIVLTSTNDFHETLLCLTGQSQM